ncbi:MAG: polyprenyl synthetase family protein [Candidatus Saccharibacteria bacterium]
MSFCSDFLPEVRERLVSELGSRMPELNDVLLQPLQSEGKLMRPRLVLLSAGLFGPIDDNIIGTAVAVECIHTASLVHDDIIDRAFLRRGVPTLSSLKGPEIAVLTGDHYFATAFHILSQMKQTKALNELTRAIREMCQGEIRQNLNLYNCDLTESEYYVSIYGKTASLFGAACRVGAIVAGASSENIEALGSFGDNLGYAYQIIDDVMDLIGDEEKMGKPAGSDLRSGVITLPIIRALQASEHREWLIKTISTRNLDNTTVKQIIEITMESGAIDHALSASRDKLQEAMRLVHTFNNPNITAELLKICSAVINLPITAGLIMHPSTAAMMVEA